MPDAGMPYEATLASTFSLWLGAKAADRAVREGRKLNLRFTGMAQTPWDSWIGDALAGVDGRTVLLEFKRSQRGMQTEQAKARRRELMDVLRRREDRLKLASRGHRLIFGVRARQGQFPAMAVPYPDALAHLPTVAKVHTAAELLNALVRGDSELGLNDVELARYLAEVMGTDQAGGDLVGLVAVVDDKGIRAVRVVNRFSRAQVIDWRAGARGAPASSAVAPNLAPPPPRRGAR
jgi:hypothetical protein